MQIKPEKLVTELNKGWVYNKDLRSFFQGYDQFSELLRSSNQINYLEVLAHYEEKIEHKVAVNDAVIRFALLRAASLGDELEGKDKFYKFVDHLVSKRCVAEHDAKSVAFLAYQGTITKKEGAFAALKKEKGQKNQELRMRRKLLRVFENFDEKNLKGFFTSLVGEDGKGSELFDAISGVHHQVVDNIDHWMGYHDNPNWSIQKGHEFGDTLIFKVSRLSVGNYDERTHSNLEPDLRRYLLEHSKKKNTPQGKFWMIEYFDNGRGIVSNLKKFGSFANDDFNLEQALEKNMSIRGNVGEDRRSGEGFSTIIDEAKRESGFLSLVSGGERLLWSPVAGDALEYSKSAGFDFGTHLTIVFPG
jgi:hypothetical protein